MPPTSSDIWDKTTLARGPLSLTLLPGLGGRLWDVSIDGRAILFRNPDLEGLAIDPAAPGALPTRSPQFGFPLWGGEKTWIAPDRDWPDGGPHPVLDSGAYRVTDAGAHSVQMTSAVCPVSRIEVTRRVSVISGAHFAIDHVLVNHGPAPRRTGIWSVMMLSQPARIAVPGAQEARAVFDHDGGRVRLRAEGLLCTCDERHQFKIAAPNPQGRSLIHSAATGVSILCRTAPPAPQDQFAHGLPFEVFNSGDYAYCEAEWHSPARDLAPGARMSFRQDFHVWRDSPPDDIDLTADEEELMRCMS